MPLSPDDLEDAQSLAGGIEVQLRLPRGFIVGLLNDTDWGFVIKLNALFESLLNTAIAQSLRAVHSDGLAEVISKLDMADVRRGKVVIATQLGLLRPDDKRFLRALAELRNRLAHSVENVAWSFLAEITLMNSEQRKSCRAKFTCCDGGIGQPIKFEENPKEFVFCGAVNVMEQIECSTPMGFVQDLRREAEIDIDEILRRDDSIDCDEDDRD